MKKAFLFVAVVSAFSFASCKKDHTCTCTTTDSNTGAVSTQKITYFKSKKSDARLFCSGESKQTVSTSGSVSVTGDKTDCKLK